MVVIPSVSEFDYHFYILQKLYTRKVAYELAFNLTGKKFKNWTARKERKCNCLQLVDIGVYNSCKHFCKYCYANFDEKEVNSNYINHNPNSTLLIGELKDTDVIKERIK